MKRPGRCFLICFLWGVLFIAGVIPQKAADTDLHNLYWNGSFSEIVSRYDNHNSIDLDLSDRLLVLESMARTGRGLAAQRQLEKVVAEPPFQKHFFSCWAWVYFSRGKFKQAEQFINRAMEIDDQFPGAVIARVMLLLYMKQYLKSEDLFEKWLNRNPHMFSSFQIFLVGIEIYNATGMGKNCLTGIPDAPFSSKKMIG